VLARVRQRAVEPRPGARPVRAPVDPGRRHRARGHRRHHPHHPRRHARRAAQALRHDRAREGAAGGTDHPQVPAAHRAQPVRLHGRVEHPADLRRRGDRRDRARAGHDRTAAARRAALAGHVPRGRHHPHRRGAHRRRHVHLRPAARRRRPARPVREGLSMVQPQLPQATPDDEAGTTADLATETGRSSRDVASASQRRLIWWRFRKHRLAMVGLVLLVAMYVVAAFAGFFAPFSTTTYSGEHAYHPPQVPRFSLQEGLFVHPTTGHTDPETLAPVFTPDESEHVHLRFFVHGDSYRLLGLVETDIHLFGPSEPGERWYPLGADRTGADLLSKIIYGSQISLSIGLVGVAISLLLGLLLGGISGYFGGTVDAVLQRVIELFMSIPTLPLWLGLAASVPP